MAYTDPKLTPKPKPWLVPGNIEDVSTPESTITKPWLLPRKQEPVEQSSTQIVPGFEREDYDKILSRGVLSPYNIGNLDYERAISQSTGSQLAHGLGRAAINLIPTVIENAASMFDFEDYLNQDDEIGNAITSAMEEWKQSVGEALPIYRENPNKPLDLGDPAWWIENGSSLVESIGGFAVTGMGLGAMLGGLSKLGQAGNMAATLLSASAMTQAESIQSATGVYNQIFEKEILSGTDPNLANEKAAKAASSVVNINRANVLLNLTSMNMFMKTPMGSRLKLKMPTTAKEIGTGLKEGAQEYAEESINYIAEQEGLDEDEQLTFEEIADRVGSAEGVEAGLLGFLGGVGQTSITNLVNRLTGKTAEEQKRYLEQVDDIESINKMLAENNLSTVSDVLMDEKQLAELNAEYSDAKLRDDKEAQDRIANKVLGYRAYKSFLNGTTEDLIGMFDKIKNLSPEEAQAKQLNTDEKSEDYYQNLADKAIKKIERDENIFNTLNLTKYYNGAKLLENRSEYKDLQEKIDELDNQINKIKNVLPEEELHKGQTSIFEALKDAYISRQKTLTKEFKEESSPKRQEELRKDLEQKVKATQEVAKETRKEIVKKDPEKLQEFSTLEPEEKKELEKVAATSSKKKRIGNDSELFPELKPEDVTKKPAEPKKTGKIFKLEDENARKSLLQETEESNNKLIEKEKLGITNYVNSKRGKPTFNKEVEARRNAIIGKKFPKEVEDTLLKYIDDLYEEVMGYKLSPVTKELRDEIDAHSKTSKGTQAFNRSKDTSRINKRTESSIRDNSEYKDPGVLTFAYSTKEKDGSVNEKFFPLINPNLFNSGAKIILRVNNDDNNVINKKTGQTWGQLKSQIKTESELSDRIPIEIIYEGKPIAYLHDITWQPEKYRDYTLLEQQREELSKLRRHIFERGEIETTVERKAAGVPEMQSNYKLISTLPNDPNLLFHVSTIEGLTNVKDEFVYDDPKFIRENHGHTYVSFVVGVENGVKKRLIWDTANITFNENKELADAVYETIETAVTIYYKNRAKQTLDAVEDKILKDIFNTTGLSLINYKDLHSYLSQFVQLANLENKQNLKELSEQYSDDLHLLALNANSLEVLVRENDEQSSKVAKFDIKATNLKQTLTLLKSKIDNYYSHVSKNAVEDNKPLILINRGKITTMYNSYNDYLKNTLKTNLNPIEVNEGVVAYVLQNRIFISNPVSTVEKKIEKKKEAKVENLEDKKAEIERRRQELESSREILTIYDLRKPIAEDSEDIISKINEANKLRQKAKEKSEQAKKEKDEDRRIALNREANSLNEKAQILDKEIKESRNFVIENTPIKKAITSSKITGQKLLNKIKLAAKSNEWVSSMAISKEEFTKLEDATKKLSVKSMGEVTSNSEVIPDILLIEEINAKYDAELATLESKETVKEVEETTTGFTFKGTTLSEKRKEITALVEDSFKGIDTKDNKKVLEVINNLLDNLNIPEETSEIIVKELQEKFEEYDPVLVKKQVLSTFTRSVVINALGQKVEKPVVKPTETTKPKKAYKRGNHIDEDIDLDFALGTDLSEVEKNTQSFLIRELGSRRQQDFVSYIVSLVVKDIKENRKVDLKSSLDPVLSDIKEDIETAKYNLELDPNDAEAKRILSVNPVIVENIETLKNIIYNSLGKVGVIKVTKKVDPQDDDEILGGDESSNEKILYNQHSAQVDTKNKVSKEMKLFMAGIHEYKKDGTIARNFLGENKFMSWEHIFNDLQNITANVLPDFQIIIERLKQYRDSRPYLTEVITQLENSSVKIKNQFVEIMSNHANHMELVLIDKSNKRYSYIIQKSNLNDVTSRIKEFWNANFFNSDIVTTNEEGEFIYDLKKVEKLIEKYKEFENEPTIEAVQSWLEDLGIVISESTWKAIREGGYKDREVTYNLESFVRKGTVKFLYDRLKKAGKKELTTEDNLLKDQSVEELAAFDSRYTMTMLSNSHRAGNKQVYSFNQNKFLINNIIDIKNLTEHEGGIFTSKILTDKLAVPFSSKSLWLHQMVEHEENGNVKYHNGEVVVNPKSPFFANFDYSTSDLEASKEAGKPSQDNREMIKLSPLEIEVTKIAREQSTNYVNRSNEKLPFNVKVGQVSYLTTSDKPTPSMIRCLLPDLSLDIDGNPTEKTYDLLMDQLVMPEILRMFSFKENKGKDFNNKEYEAGAKHFLIIPELNYIEDIFDSEGYINAAVNSAEDTTLMDKIREELKKHITQLISDKKEKWDNWGIGKTVKWKNGDDRYIDSYIDVKFAQNFLKSKDKLNGAATYHVLQNLISNVNIAMVFATDPANYFDNKGKTLDQKIRSAFTNLGKRLAADAGPKTSNQDSLTSITREAVVEDLELSSLFFEEYLEKLDGLTMEQFNALSKNEQKKLNSYPYYDIKGTDAQELVTVSEHLRDLHTRGRLHPLLYPNASKIIREEIEKGNHYYNKIVYDKLEEIEKGLGEEYDKVVLTPVKPQYTYNVFDPTLLVERRVFIKSSAYPLSDRFTKHMGMDKLRIAMESQNIDRLAFKSAVKTGAPSAKTYLWENKVMKNAPSKEIIREYDSLRQFKERSKEDQERFEDLEANYIFFNSTNTLELPRRGYGIQQESPYDPEEDTINRVTQAHKNIFVDLLDVLGFQYDGKTLSGKELSDIYNQKFKGLFETLTEELREELGVGENFQITPDLVNKVKEVISKEMMERNYPISEIEFLKLDKSLEMIAFLPSSARLEALLNSIVKNRILKMKFPGYSFIVGSEEGYQITEDFKKYKDGIVFTNKFKGTLGRNQVIIPFTFKGKNGELLDLRSFVDKNGNIDTEMLPEELLEMFAMRIPNSSQSLQSVVEVVGFLPTQSDLIIATRDFISKMGQDFDKDKMYIYRTATEFIEGKDGKKGYLKRSEDKKENIMNDIIDIMKAVHKNPEAYNKVNTPLGMWKLQDIADDIENINASKKKIFSGFSEEYQTNKFIQATQAKSAVGIYAALSIFNAMAQERNLVLTERDFEGNRIPVVTRFGSKVSEGDMSSKQTLSKTTNKSVVIEGTLSSSLDNEKLQILDKLNMNKDTFSVVSLLEMLGFEEEIFYFTTQESIAKYFDIKNTALSNGEFLNETQLVNRIAEEYSKHDPSIKDMLKADPEGNLNGFKENADDLGYKQLREMLIQGDTYPDYYKHQLGLLVKFLRLDTYAASMGTPLKLLSVDSQGFGKSLLEANEFVDALKNIQKNNILNADSMFGDFDEDGNLITPTTIPGFSLYYGLMTNNNLWNQFFPYDKLGYLTYRETLGKYLKIHTTISASFELSKMAWESMKSYLYSKQNLGLLNNETIEQFRERAFFGDNSLDKILLKVKGRLKNDFLNALDVKVGKGKIPSLVTYKASTKENDDELRLYASFLDLLLNEQELGLNGKPLTIKGKRYTSRNLYHDLVTAFYVAGGNQKANQYGKYISPSYLYSLPFGKELMGFNFRNPANLGISYDLLKNENYIPSVVIQIIQHHPELIGKKINSKSLEVTKEGVLIKPGTLDEGEPQPKIFAVHNNKDSYGRKAYVPYIMTGTKSTTDGEVYLYTRLNNKGTTDFDEYNSNIKWNEVDSSILAKNPVKITLNYQDFSGTEEHPIPENQADYTFEDIGLRDTTSVEDSEKVIKQVLNDISSESTNPYFRELAGWFGNYVKFDIKKINILKASKFNKGQYEHSKKELTFWLHKYSKTSLEDTFLHELTHHITRNAIDSDKQTIAELEVIRKKVENIIKERDDLKTDYYIFQQFMHERKINSLKESIKELEKLRKEGNKEEQKEIDKKIKKANEDIQSERKKIYNISKIIGQVENAGSFIKQNQERFDKIKPIVYGVYNVTEFTEAVLKDEAMQRFLNEIPSDNPKKKSVFHEVLDKLLTVIRDFIGVKKGSLLEEALESAIKLINIYPENFTSPSVTEREEKPINIYAGTRENADLSNFAIRPFTIDYGAEDWIMNGLKFQSVEQAFQYFKLEYSDFNDINASIEKKILNTNNGEQLKKLGNSLVGLNIEKWNKSSSMIMKTLISLSFIQNPNSLKRLLDTGNTILTHIQDKGKWGKEFPRILMEVRDELRDYNRTEDELDFDISWVPTVDETLQQFGEKNLDGSKKKLRVQTDGSNTNYKAMLKRVIDINQNQKFYKASVIKTLVNNKEFWTISLEKSNNLLTFEDRYDSITDDIVRKFIENCR